VRWPNGEWRASVAYSVIYEWGPASTCGRCPLSEYGYPGVIGKSPSAGSVDL
jgi:hypothetical protein